MDQVIRAARAVLGLTTKELADAAGISINPVTRLERDKGVHKASADSIQLALEAKGIEFLNSGQRGIRWRA